jgi:hypothetical protein
MISTFSLFAKNPAAPAVRREAEEHSHIRRQRKISGKSSEHALFEIIRRSLIPCKFLNFPRRTTPAQRRI